jgi:cell division septation protein DedD
MRQTYSQYHDPDERLGLVGEDRADEFSRPDRRLPTIFLSVLAMALFAGGLWFAYVQGTRHAAVTAPGDAVPLIRADERATKVKPDQPGGMTIPDQNVSLYNEKPGGTPVEKLLPAPEQPLPRPVPAAREATPAAPPSVPATQQPPAQPAAKAAASAAPKPAAAAPAKPAATPAALPGGKVQLQLGSLRSPEAAREDWSRLKRENPDLLGKLTAVAVRTDLGDKGIYYRVLAGSFSDAAAAEKLCGELKRRNLGCVLAR